MEFLWILKKYHVKDPGVNWKRSTSVTSRTDQENIMKNFLMNFHTVSLYVWT